MGKSLGAVTGAFIQDRAIREGVKRGRESYGDAIRSYQAGKEAALGRLQPYIGLGQEAVSPLAGLLLGKTFNAETGKYEEISPDQRMALFQESPDYQFRLQQGQKALEASQAARGGLLSGRALQESQALGQNLASQEYGNYLARLGTLANIGQTSAGQMAGYDTGTAANIAGAQVGSGALAMQGRIARGQVLSDTAQTIGSESHRAGQSMFKAGAMSPQAAALFSDRTLKENIEAIGSENGYPIYSFEYKDKSFGKGRYKGVIAQDILKLKPEAVEEIDGKLAVNYDKLGIKFEEI